MMSTSTPTAHASTIELAQPAPDALAVGSAVTVKLKVHCTEGCDLHGSQITVVPPDGWVTTSPLERFTDGVNESGEIVLNAPKSVGEHFWSFSLALHADNVTHDGVLHLGIKTRAQTSSLAVWSIPSPVTTGENFEIAVGAKSESGYPLAGTAIEVCDQDGTVVGRAKLGDTPWEGTTALYWTPVTLAAPTALGMLTWSVRYTAGGAELPHDGSSAVFSFVVAAPPEHQLTVRVAAEEGPVADAQVRLGAFRGVTDAAGVAQLHLPSGHYDLMVWKAGYQAPVRSIEVGHSMAVDVEALKLPEENYDTHWRM